MFGEKLMDCLIHKTLKIMKKIILFTSGMFLLVNHVLPQEPGSHNHILNFNYLQLKDEMNYGLVFRGGGISYAFTNQWQNDRSGVCYEALLGLTYMQTRTVPAANLHIRPAKICYLFKGVYGSNLMTGPFFLADYNYQFYPDLHSGHSLWFTHIGLGGMVQYDQTIGRHRLSFSMSTSLFGLTSRQPVYHDPYFWDLSAGDIVKYFHRDLGFGSWNEYNCSELEIRWLPSENSRIIFSYEVDIMGYFRAPGLTVVNQSIKLIFQPKSK